MTAAASGPLDEPGLRRRVERALPDPSRTDEVIATYRTGRPEATPDQVLVAIVTDQVFRIPAMRLADAQAAHNAAPWLYTFNHHRSEERRLGNKWAHTSSTMGARNK